MSETSIELIQDIIGKGVKAVQSRGKTGADELDALIIKLEAEEQQFYAQLPKMANGLPVTTAAEFNQLVKEIDTLYNLKALLPNEMVEQQMMRLYDFESKAAKMSEDEQKYIIQVMDKLYKKGREYMEDESYDIWTRNVTQYTPQIRDYILSVMTLGIEKSNLANDKKKGLINMDIANSIIGGRTKSKDLLKNPVSIMKIDFKEPLIETTKDSKKYDLTALRGAGNVRDFSYEIETKSQADEKGFIINRWTSLNVNSIEITGKGGLLSKEFPEELREYFLEIGPEILDEVKKENGINSNSTATKKNLNVSLSEFKADAISLIEEATGNKNISNVVPFGEIAIGRSINNLRGFLGEVRSYLLGYYIFNINGTGSVKATGLKDKVKLMEELNPEEAPVDTFIQLANKAYGIQVKNTINTNYAWENEMSASNFYQERLQTTLLKEESDYFGAYSYNYPIARDKTAFDKLSANQQKRAKEYDVAFEKEYTDSFKEFSLIYRNLSYKIMRLSTEILENEIFGTQANNHFFLMKDKIIAASDILKELKKNPTGSFSESISNENGSISNSYSSDYLTSSFSIVRNPKNVWNPGKDKEINYQDLSFIKYSVRLLYKKLVTSAYQITD